MEYVRIRPLDPTEVAVARDIERAAGEPFRAVGMSEIADDDPPAAAVLLEFVHAGRAWAADLDGTVVAYLIALPVDGNMHVEQVSVHPAAARRGIGAALIDHLAAVSAVPALTLTTFTEVPWNGPYYRRCGFRVLTEPELTPGLRAIRDAETAHGLYRWPRATMRRDLP